MPKPMEIKEVGNVYELRRDQWRGHVAKITKDPDLLRAIKEYTWTYRDGAHPYLHSSALNMYFHEFVLGYIYGAKFIDEMQAKGNIIEHLDNDGMNTFENMHILSEDLNKAKAFTIDKMTASRKKAFLYRLMFWMFITNMMLRCFSYRYL
ncbi:hypothetical protein DWW36_13310 [Erysipelotrichaceae bacterium AF15-26LB]|nr:hypothetical protein [[Clostridium] innocuum]RJV86509.1 hypothetical protein DWW36_13310 [Erysipelotrichaceae bacterium AF15-26LB]RJV89660.1 hypothetical protein DWX45_11045 [Erysipelotrichaceae bacterium AF19-24AC]